MDDLIAELEAAESGSRELDEKIGKALNLEPLCYGNIRGQMDAPIWHEYSSFLDAKLPWERIVYVKLEEHQTPDKRFTALHRREGDAMQRWKEGKAHTEALARRISALQDAAALRARQAMEGKD